MFCGRLWVFVSAFPPRPLSCCQPVSQHSPILGLPGPHSASVIQTTPGMVASPIYSLALSFSAVFLHGSHLCVSVSQMPHTHCEKARTITVYSMEDINQTPYLYHLFESSPALQIVRNLKSGISMCRLHRCPAEQSRARVPAGSA